MQYKIPELPSYDERASKTAYTYLLDRRGDLHSPLGCSESNPGPSLLEPVLRIHIPVMDPDPDPFSLS
jgi:hypothetical protein